MKTKKKSSRNGNVVALAVVAFVAGLLMGVFWVPQQPALLSQPASLKGASHIVMDVPAVDNEGSGVLGKLITEVGPGSGQVLVNIADVITLGDTQQSALDAVRAAAAYMHVDENSIDVIFNMEVNATAIEGPSAGANMAVAVVFGLRNETPREEVAMTGTIDENGRIGQVGAVFEKAQAAKDGGAAIFLVPDGQSVESQTVRTRQCRKVGNGQQCKIVYKPTSVNIGSELNMTVAEVSDLSEAVKYFEK